jgi:hypothetical protein
MPPGRVRAAGAVVAAAVVAAAVVAAAVVAAETTELVAEAGPFIE